MGMWKLDDTSLGDSTTEIFITGYQRDAEVRTAAVAIHGGTEYWERLGKNLTRLNLVFTILGQDTKKHDWVAFIIGILENRTYVRLESPSDDEDVRTLDASRFILFSADGRPTVQQQNRAQYDITIPVVVHGIPVDQGGSAFEDMSGFFTFLENDFWAATNSAGYVGVPLIGMPLQPPGEPRFVSNTSPYAVTSAGEPRWTLTAMDEYGAVATVEIYDVTAFAFNRPWAEGTGGPIASRR